MPDRVTIPMWLGAATASFTSAVVLDLLAYRILLQGPPLPGGLAGLATLPPRDFPEYPLVTLLLCVGAIVWRSPKSLLVVQAVLFVVGFLHVEWIMGWIPEKIDPRVFETALIAHAIAWSSVLCGFAALFTGLRRPQEIRKPKRRP